MKDLKKERMNDSKTMRWGVLGIISVTMLAAYFVNDVMAPLKGMLESNIGWTSTEFGTYTGAYSFLNVFVLMLIWGGLMLDRFGARFTGKLAASLMVLGTALQYFSITSLAGAEGVILGMKTSVFVASAGYSIFGVGAEVAGITVTKIIAKWFRGKDMATAMGVQVAIARVGSQVAYSVAIPVAKLFGISTPLLIGLVLLVIGLITFFIFSRMDKKFDQQLEDMRKEGDEEEEKFSFSHIKNILNNQGFWLIALLCVLFYSCVFPFQKYASELMISKYGISADIAGTVAGLPALGALFLTPIFGRMVDKKGKAASIMMLGAGLLIFVHCIYSLPFITYWPIAIALMVVLGIAFSLVPSAMWPSVAKIFPQNQLGTAYALIFLIQNVGLWGVPTLIGFVLDKYCIVGQQMVDGKEVNIYDYTLPMLIFVGFAVASLFVAFALKLVDKRNGYHLEDANI